MKWVRGEGQEEGGEGGVDVLPRTVSLFTKSERSIEEEISTRASRNFFRAGI